MEPWVEQALELTEIFNYPDLLGPNTHEAAAGISHIVSLLINALLFKNK